MQTPDLSCTVWRKSTHSGPTGDNCVEVAVIGQNVAVRDSKNLTQAALVLRASAWGVLISRIKSGKEAQKIIF